MTKTCWQEKVETATPCFYRGGGVPCSEDDCLVDKRIKNIGGVDKVSTAFLNLLLHSCCRMSSLSKDNSEFLERVGR